MIINNIISYLPKRKQKMFELQEQPLSKKEIEKSQMILVQLAKDMGESGDINLEELMEDAEDMIE